MTARTCAAILLAAALAGCGALQPIQSLLEPVRQDQAGRIAGERIDARDPELGALEAHNRQRREELNTAVMQTPARAGSGLIGEVDVGRALSPAKPGGAAAAARGRASEVTLVFDDTSLKDIVTVFMKDYLKQPYTFQDSFKDRKVNLFFQARATREDLIQLFDSLLENYGVRLRYAGGVYLVGSSEDKASPLQQPSPLGIGDAIGVVRLKFVEVRDFLALAKQVVKYPDKLSALPNNVLVVNSTSTDLRAVRSLVEDVDVPAFAGKYILLYAPRHLSAASLIAVLESAQSQLAGAPTATKQFEAKQIPDNERLVIIAANRVARDLVLQLLSQSDAADANQRRVFQYILGTQSAPDILANLNTLIKSVVKSPAEVNVVADKASNSLFIHASPQEYAEIGKLLARMDFRPPSVQIDMIIAEVNLSDSMQYGVELFLHRARNIDQSAGSYFGAPLRETGTNRILGLSANLVEGLDRFATLQLIGNETSFTLLSNPKIVVKNGATAKITVAQEQPVIRQKTQVNVTGGSTVIEPEFKKVGLELEVTPTVSADNLVRVVIKLRDTAIVGNVILGTDTFPILSTRELNTDLVTADGRTIFLGGIRRQNTNDKANRVPGLADLPGLGALFRDKRQESIGQELIILATPTVILDQFGADTVTRALLRAARQEIPDLRPPVKQPAQ